MLRLEFAPCCPSNYYFKYQIDRVIILYHRKNCCQESKKSARSKWTYELFGNDYRVATFSKTYPIIMQSLKSLGQF